MNDRHDVESQPQQTDGTSLDDERPEKSPKAEVRTRLKHHLLQDISTKKTDLILIGCSFVSGLLDSFALNVWDCFVGMQTGNVVLFGLGVTGNRANSPSFAWIRALITIVVFTLGTLFFSNLHRFLGPLKRWVVILSFMIQTILLAAAASTLYIHGVSPLHLITINREDLFNHKITDPGIFIPWLDLLPLSFLAFQSAGQVVASRVLGVNFLPTVVLTTLMTDYTSDVHHIVKGPFKNAQQNRRLAGIMALFAGAIVGGAINHAWTRLEWTLWFAAFLKALMVGLWWFWPADTTVIEGG